LRLPFLICMALRSKQNERPHFLSSLGFARWDQQKWRHRIWIAIQNTRQSIWESSGEGQPALHRKWLYHLPSIHWFPTASEKNQKFNYHDFGFLFWVASTREP
jgi:hypothetical protein